MRGEKLRFCFIGVGRRGLDHIRVASRFKEISLEAACDIDKSRLKRVADTYGIRVYTDLNEMLKREKLDVAVISTPTSLHVPQTIKCIEAGLDVLMEKPISLSIEDATKLLRVVQRSDRIVMVGFQVRYSDIVDRIKEMIDYNTLSMIIGYWYWTIPIIKWIRRRDQGGGQIVDQAIHLIDLFRFFVGEVEMVHAIYTERGRNTEEDRRVGFDNWASYIVSLRFKNNIIGCIYSTYALYPNIFQAKEQGEIKDVATRESSVMIDIICREILIRYRYPLVATVYRKNQEPLTYRDTVGDPTFNMYEAFIKAVMSRDKSLIRTPYEDSYKTMAVALAANESAISGRMIVIDEFIKIG